MDIKPYVQSYEQAIQIPSNLERRKKTLLLGQQLKVVRDEFCHRTKAHEKVLEAQYSYIITYLNHRHSLWSYDYMTFPRRVGELWESFCKASFKNSPSIRPYNPPNFERVRRDLTRRKVPSVLWDIVGDVNMKTDGMFYCHKRLHVVDLKSSFNSHEKGNFQRLRTVGAVYKLWRPRSKRLIIVREKDDNADYLDKLSDYWDVRCGDEAYNTIRDLTSIDLKSWINTHVDFKRHLNSDLYTYLQRRELTKYLVW